MHGLRCKVKSAKIDERSPTRSTWGLLLRSFGFDLRAGVSWRTVALVTVLASVSTIQCSRQAMHRTLVFFYDGVPPLDGGGPDALNSPSQAASNKDAVEPAALSGTVSTLYLHPAYKENRCGGCHQEESGGLLKTAREGLCLACHATNPPKKEYVHAPVAVRDCLACHSYHKSRYEHLLTADVQTVCATCHGEGPCTGEQQLDPAGEKTCVECHDPHGGDDPFFLLPDTATLAPS